MGLKVIAPERLELQGIGEAAVLVTATYQRTGIRRSGRRLYPTVLVTNVRVAADGRLVSDHLWFNRGAIWKTVDLHSGDRIEFEARAIEYRSGYWGADKIRRADSPPRVEFKLTPPKRIAIVRSSQHRRAAA